MPRLIARFVFVTLLGIVATVLGVVAALVLTPPGRDLLARNVSSELSRVVNGSVSIGSISGSFLYDLMLERLVVRDTSGVLLVDLPRVRVGYRLPNLLAGRFVLGRLHVDRPVIQLIKHRNGRMNYEDVLRLGQGKAGGASPLIEFDDVRIHEGTLRVELPWSPPNTLRTERQRDSAIAAERAKPGRVIDPSAEGLRRIISFDQLATAVRRLQISTPDHKPFTIDLDSLATRVSDPQVDVRDAAGRISFRGDSVVFSLRRGALPNTRFSGGGVVTWPRDSVLYDFEFVSPKVNLVDLRWVSPNFPELTGRGTLAAKSENGTRTAFVIRGLHLARGAQRVDGDLTALDDHRRGLGVRDMRVTLKNVDLDEARPYVPTLPFYGMLSGSLAGNGYLDGLNVQLDWLFEDADVPGRPVSHIVANGRVVLGGQAGLVFQDLAVTESDIDLGTVRNLAPAVILQGRLMGQGTLNGPLRDVTFEGTARHRDSDRPASEIQGLVRLDTRTDTLGLTTDVALQPLSFDGIRRTFPGLTSQGSLTGRVRLDGTLSHLAVNASVSGEVGTIEAEGMATVRPPNWGAENLRLTFGRLDLSALSDSGLATSLNGTLRVTGTADSGRAPEGDLAVALGRSRVREFKLDTLAARGSVHDSVIAVDTLGGRVAGITLHGAGQLGWARPHQGRMAFVLSTDSLRTFDSLFMATTGLAPDTAQSAKPLGGSVQASLTLLGSLDSLDVSGAGLARQLEWGRFRSAEAKATLGYLGGKRPHLAFNLATDSVTYEQRIFRDLVLEARGHTDSLEWSGSAGVGRTVQSRFTGQGRWWRRGETQLFALDSVRARLAAHEWRLESPATITLRDSAPEVTPLAISATDGSGRIVVEGSVPGQRTGALSIDAFGVNVKDLYALLQRDTLGLSGSVGLTLDVGGTAAAPTIRGSAQLADATAGDFQAPFAQGVVNYADRRLQANLLLWRSGVRVIEVEASLPLDLGFSGVKERQLDGPLMVRARADSADLGILEAITPGIRNVEGQLVAEAAIKGTWKSPEVSGFATVSRGAMTIPGIGVRYAAILGRAEFRKDSLIIPYALVTSGNGTLQITGSLKLENLAKPVLDLVLEANRFQALNVRNFLSLTATGNVQLKGPVLNATATGSGTVNEGVFYFADLLKKRIIDLEDPTLRDLVDTTLIREAKLGARFENRFLDSLAVNNLHLEMGEGVFLRSTEANIQLSGRVDVNKAKGEYRPSGTLEAVRGLYTLKIGPVNRDFTVNRGTVRYFGTPDLNAELDIEAEHDVRTARGEEIPVIAKIKGTLFVPKLELSTTGGRNVSEADLVSYLVTGYSTADAFAAGVGSQVSAAAASLVVGAVSSEFERALISNLGIPIDYVQFTPPVSTGGIGATAVGRLEFGWRIGPKTFITLDAGVCPQSQATPVNFGASLEYRFSRAWHAQTSFEPTYNLCGASGNPYGLTNSRYQIGADVFWEKEF